MTLVMAEILVTHPQASPDSGPLASLDPWGRAYQYLRKSDIAGVLYSRGANGVDEAGTGDDLYEPLVWPLPDPS